MTDLDPTAAPRLRPDRTAPPPAPRDADISPPGEQLDRYPVTEVLGQGGMGMVLRVEDLRLERPVAAKVILGQADERQRRRFVREAQITGQLEHPNIVPIYELGAAESADYFTMKQVRGEDLGRVLGRRPPRLALLQIFVKVCDAMSYAHSRGVIHRDLKPANIMVGEFGEVLVMDWGLARRLDDAEAPAPETPPVQGDALRTQDGAVIGTLAYMAPEQARGERERVDARSDQYSLGAVLYEMISGLRPHEAATHWELLATVSRGVVVPPSERVDEALQIPWELESVVMKAMAADPAERYPDVAAMQADVQRYLDGRVVTAARYGPWRLLRRWLVRHRWRIAVAVALVAVGLGGAAFQSATSQRERARVLADARREALARVGALPSIGDLRAALGRGSDAERARPLIARHLDAVAQVERALALAPSDAGLRGARRRCGEGWALASALAGDHRTARQLTDGLDAWVRRPERTGRLRQELRAAREAGLRRRKARLEAMLTALAEGLGTSGEFASFRLEDLVFEASSYREAQTVALLGGLLDRLIADRIAPGRAASEPVRWTQAERDQATFASRVLGRIGSADAVAALGRWLRAIGDSRLFVEAARALCNTRHVAAHPHIVHAFLHGQLNSAEWTAIAPLVERLPEPPGFAAAELDDASLASQRALLRLLSRRYLEAIRDAERGLKLRPGEWRFYNLRGRALAALGKHRQAVADFDRVLAAQPELVSVMLLRADAKLALRDAAGALADLDRATALRVGDPLLRASRGKVLVRLGRHDEALAVYDAVIAALPTHPLVHQDRANVLIELGQYRRALADLDRALALGGPRADTLNSRALARAKLGDRDGALADIDAALADDPRHVLAHRTRGMVLRERGDLDAALEAYQRAVRLAPGDAVSHAELGLTHMLRRDLGPALTCVERAIELDPRYVRARVSRGLILEQQGRPGDALRTYTEAIRIAPGDPQPYLQRAALHRDQRRTAEALADGRRALALAGRQVGVLFEAGLLLWQLGQRPRAQSAFERVLAIDPRHADARCNRAMLREEQGDAVGALAGYRQTLSGAPGHRKAALRLIELHLRSNRPQEALAASDRRLVVAPRDGLAHYCRGRAQLALGRPVDAREALERALQLEPRLWGARLELARAQVASGQRDAAVATLRAALPQVPARHRAEVEARLRQLESGR